MKILDNIGLVLLLFSIASIVFWSPRPYSSTHVLDDTIDKISRKGQYFREKTKTIPFKTDFSITDTIGRMKLDVEDSKDLYRNSLTRTNEEIVKPTLNEISNWVGVDQDPSTTQEHLNKPEEKPFELKVAAREIEKEDLGASHINLNNLKDTIYSQNIDLYKQTTTTYDQSRAAIEKADDWVVDHAHEVFDKSGSIVDVAENEVGKIIDTTFQEMDMKKSFKFPDNSISNIAGSSEENVCPKDPNDSNILHNNLQMIDTNTIESIESDVENTTNLVHNNVRLLEDNSNDFITENVHENSQELGKRRDQIFKDTRLNLIKQSFTEVNNLGSTFDDDSKINEVKNELNSPTQLHNSWNDQESIYDQNENSYGDTKKNHHEISSQQNECVQGDYEGVKGRIVKYSHSFYEDAKVDTNFDFKTSKYIQHAKNHAHRHYRDGRHKASQVYNPINDAIRNFGKNKQYNEYDGNDDDEDDDEDNDEYDDDEDSYEEF